MEQGKLHFIWNPTPEQVATWLPTPVPTPPAQPAQTNQTNQPLKLVLKPLTQSATPVANTTPAPKVKKEKPPKKLVLQKSVSPPVSTQQSSPSVPPTPIHQVPPTVPKLKFKLKLGKSKEISSGIPSPDNVY